MDKWYKCVWDTLFVSSGLVTPESQKVLDDWKTWVRISVCNDCQRDKNASIAARTGSSTLF